MHKHQGLFLNETIPTLKINQRVNIRKPLTDYQRAGGVDGASYFLLLFVFISQFRGNITDNM